MLEHRGNVGKNDLKGEGIKLETFPTKRPDAVHLGMRLISKNAKQLGQGAVPVRSSSGELKWLSKCAPENRDSRTDKLVKSWRLTNSFLERGLEIESRTEQVEPEMTDCKWWMELRRKYVGIASGKFK